MTFQDLEFELLMNGVAPNDVDYILGFSKKNGVLGELIDEELVKMGYDKIFDSIDDDWNDDDDFGHIEKFPHRNKFLED